ncbi:hypothetical protein [Ancylobacter polymorphus]|uniref:Uncharacterized protein n=1 Tax=Ancylobacter polymorphus TaxID=223390 RepID=A0ABU0BEJ6_9HYPH|nr:hypothetical protein [Ancylobacter polymorphus]MDQ0303820.1 hypothetical protein [Ancylobacter polymorphus]
MSETAQAYDWSEDGIGNYALAILAMREIGVREGMYAPLDDRERRQAEEGPVRALDCVKEATDAR